MKSKVLLNQEEKRKKLLEAAFFLMTKKDLKDISIAELAKEAGVAKGTFYLYFKDKYELRDLLIQIECEKLFDQAWEALAQNDIENFEDAVIFVINHVLLRLEANPVLLNFIKFNLSWGVFKKALGPQLSENTFLSENRFPALAEKDGYYFEDPSLIFFIILEMTGSVCYNCIVNGYPTTMKVMKPYLYSSIRAVLKQGKQKQ